MSALSSICGYGYTSNSDESESENDNPKLVKQKFPAPDLSKISVIPSDNHLDNPELHDGRIRSFPHVRGNWATFVYLKYPDEEFLIKLISKLQALVNSIDESFQRCDYLHISLSRTVVLKYHLITPFTTSLQKSLIGIESFELEFTTVKVYCNEDNTRTFIALELDHFVNRSLLNITKKVDEVLADYNLPQFYKDPAFHVSVLWCHGNKKTEINNILDKLNYIVTQEFHEIKTVLIEKLLCKIGNKTFQYYLE